MVERRGILWAVSTLLNPIDARAFTLCSDQI